MDVREDGAIAAFQRGDLALARELARGQLAAEPHAPALLHLMGLIQCRSGEIESGVEWLRRALEAEPGNTAYRVMLARALADCGRAQEALEVAQRPDGISPAELALWHARAEAATAVEAWPDAAEAWGAMCSAGVRDWRAWSNFGDALGAMGRWHEAAPALERAAALNPAEPSLRRNLGGALNNAGRFEEAVTELRRCIETAPNDKSLRISLAAILADLGRGQESQVELNRAAKLAGEGEAREDGVGLVQIALDATGAVDVIALRELADLLERINRVEALGKLLDDAVSLGVAPEQIGYSAAAAALRRGDPAEGRR